MPEEQEEVEGNRRGGSRKWRGCWMHSQCPETSLGVAGSDSYLISAVTWRMDLVGMKKKRSRDQS